MAKYIKDNRILTEDEALEEDRQTRQGCSGLIFLFIAATNAYNYFGMETPTDKMTVIGISILSFYLGLKLYKIFWLAVILGIIGFAGTIFFKWLFQ